ncbi:MULTISPECIES: hypothetical protein [Parachlamydia]|jgi:hypothetical protein|uniref:Uncharacterized protein n=2 Tax=Parachlamydia acanthamoebae TaxID=83552 RepID=F8KWK0_PARAV|nr:hypothetical protein [Parachlamydia acanthamoebae]EFB40330.1 hypothetical protein pah_c207o015 [Parachlamydia acanthamoebae str. Hall's coccus]KIA76179.1 hypothetical protein DB43_AS00490 [Parachlamydia acanthamoebae]CCB85402.1 putative uncharacterized protein [Parachlamydia acanthamoebae UV-7]
MAVGIYNSTSTFQNEYIKSTCRKSTGQRVTFSNIYLRVEALKMAIVHAAGAPFSSAFIVSHFAKNFFNLMENVYSDPGIKNNEPLSGPFDRYCNNIFRHAQPLFDDFLAFVTFPAFRTLLIVREVAAAVIHPAIIYG